MKAICAPASTNLPDGEHYNVEHYLFVEASRAQMRLYYRLVEDTYGPLGFLNDHAGSFMPRKGSSCYVLTYRGDVIGSCSLTEVLDDKSVFHQYIPGQANSEAGKMMELNNIILVPELRGGVGLALILYHATLVAISKGAELIVGITRYQTLRHFVDAGATPIDHEPLHLLGRDDLHDFIIYYDVRTEDARTYLRERARRLFGQNSVMQGIKSRVAPKVSSKNPKCPADHHAIEISA